MLLHPSLLNSRPLACFYCPSYCTYHNKSPFPSLYPLCSGQKHPSFHHLPTLSISISRCPFPTFSPRYLPTLLCPPPNVRPHTPPNKTCSTHWSQYFSTKRLLEDTFYCLFGTKTPNLFFFLWPPPTLTAPTPPNRPASFHISHL